MKPNVFFVASAFFACTPLSPQLAAQQGQNAVTANAVATASTSAADLRHFLRQSAGDPSAPPAEAALATPGMKLIPGGTVSIGTPVEDVEKLGQKDPVYMVQVLAEVPRHTAKVADFLIDETEVTNAQWKAFLDATGRKPTATLIEFYWKDGVVPEGYENHPVTNVNVFEIRDFLEWCGKRLPTEQEWERAARGDDLRPFPWGDKWNGKLCRSGMDSTGHPEPVGIFPGGASPYGVLDMAGNVAEWVDAKFTPYDGFAPLTYTAGKKERQLIPEFASNASVVKGGSFLTTSTFTRIDARFGVLPVNSGEAVGFRAARSTRPGLDAVRHGVRSLQPAQLVGPGIDETDCFGREDMTYDDAHKVITGFRLLALAHRGAERGPSLSKLRSQSVDEPAALAVVSTSEPLKMPDMKQSGTKNTPQLPPGSYLLSFKGKGESKAHKEKRRAQQKDGGRAEKAAEGANGDKSTEKPGADDSKAAPKNGKKSGGKDAPKDDAKDDSKDDSKAGTEEAPGAAVPWPGVSSVHTATEDIEFPQDDDLILFINDNNAVVGWAKCDGIEDQELAPHKAVGSDENRTWDISFSLDQMTGKRGPRFHVKLELAGAGI